MEWPDYYDRFYNWTESTQISRISMLTDFGPSCQVFEIIQNISDDKAVIRLIYEVLVDGVCFYVDEIIELAIQLSELLNDFYYTVAKTTLQYFY